VSPTDRSRFVDAVLDAYTATPGTTGHVRSADRRLAPDLFDHHVPLDVVTAAFALAASRRVNRPDNAVAGYDKSRDSGCGARFSGVVGD
jgi:hypothetical protein